MKSREDFYNKKREELMSQFDPSKLKVFIFWNSRKNYCRGPYYFIAFNRGDAISQAKAFQTKNNEWAKNRPAYIIVFNFSDISSYPLERGFLPLNMKTPKFLKKDT